MLCVSLLVRLWVEIFVLPQSWNAFLSASLWGCELKYTREIYYDNDGLSASLWGCELKFKSLVAQIAVGEVSLLVRLWVEMLLSRCLRQMLVRQPPCEAVSWNVYDATRCRWCDGQPPCEAVSWNMGESTSAWTSDGQPPCEAVSWNSVKVGKMPRLQTSASLWGCELKCWLLKGYHLSQKSASLWGCELKCKTIISIRRKRQSASLWGCELK